MGTYDRLYQSFTVCVLLFDFLIVLFVYKKVDVVFLHFYYLDIYRYGKGYTNNNTSTFV